MNHQPGGPLSVDVDGAGTLVVHGDIDIAGGPTLEAYIQRYADGQPIVLDLDDVAFIDSSGLRTLLIAAGRDGKNGSAVRLRNVGATVRRMLEMTGTAGQFEIEE
jgi:anti-anti-sigma factor